MQSQNLFPYVFLNVRTDIEKGRLYLLLCVRTINGAARNGLLKGRVGGGGGGSAIHQLKKKIPTDSE